MTDPDDLMTTEQAARALFVRPGTIRQWVHRGLLTPAVAGGPDVQALFWEQDVADAESRTRRRPRLDYLIDLAQVDAGMVTNV